MLVDVFTDYKILMQKMDHENKEIICIGGFNCDWLSPEKTDTKKLSQVANMFQLEQFIKEQNYLSNSNAD